MSSMKRRRLPVPRDALGGDEGDEVGGRLLDDAVAGELEAAKQHGLPGARRAGEDVALHGNSAWGGGRASSRPGLAVSIGGFASAARELGSAGNEDDSRSAEAEQWRQAGMNFSATPLLQ